MHIKVLWQTWAVWKVSVSHASENQHLSLEWVFPIYLLNFVCLPGLCALLWGASYGLFASKPKLEAG